MEKNIPNNGINAREEDSQKIGHLSAFQQFPPKAIKLEVSSFCNFKCKMCYNKNLKAREFLTPANFKIALENILDIGVKQVGVLFLGESTLNDNLPDYIQQLKDAGIPYVFLTTNGLYVKDRLMKALFDAGLDSLKWSINYYSPESFSAETQQQQVQFFQILENMKNAKTYRDLHARHTKLYMSTVIDCYDNYSKFNELTKDLSLYVDETVVNLKTNQGGLLDNDICTNLKCGTPCPRLFNNMYIRSNLDVMCCCNGFTVDFKIGSLKDNTLKELWNCKKLQHLRQCHIDQKFDNDTVCLNKSNANEQI